MTSDEEEFLRTQAMNESSGEYNSSDGVTDPQTKPSDEHEPVQDVQEPSGLSLPAEASADGPSQPDSTVPQTSPAIPSEADTGTSNSGEVQGESSAQPQSISAAPKARHAHDKIGLLEDRIKDDKKGDMDAWLSLIAEYKNRGKLEDARKVYERFFAVFPWAAEQWVAFAQFESEAGNLEGVNAIFVRTLTSFPSLQLWSAYLDHVRRLHNIATDKTGQASQTIHKAFEAVLNAVGIDKDSGKVWTDYIQFIKSGPGMLGGTSWQDQQKMDLLRKTYSRAICIPTQAIESIWKEYSNFEQELNKSTGRKFVQEKSRSYMSARTSHTELQTITRELKRTTLPTLPPALGFDGEEEYMKQVGIWKSWILWEKGDPLVLKVEDPASYKARIIYVYKQALMALRFWPEMWFDAAEFCFNNDLDTQGEEFLSQGIAANPENCLLTFKYADRLEMSTTNGNDDESKAKRAQLVRQPYDKITDALDHLIGKAKAREAKELTRVEAEFSATVNGAAESERDERDEEERSKEIELKKQAKIDSIKAMNSFQIGLLRKTISHVHIALMRAMFRMQGKGKPGSLIGGSRMILQEARKQGRSTPEMWIEGAMVEHYDGDKEMAKKVFDKGMALWQHDERYVLEYIKYLISTNDINNARPVFERAVKQFSQNPETVSKAKQLYVFFHDHESRYGDLTQVVKLEKRMKETFPNDSRLGTFSQRFVNEGFDPTAIRPIISPAVQTRPKVIHRPETITISVESPTPAVPEPKRPLPLDESDHEVSRPRKLARGESPLKGAAGRRQALPSSLPRDVLFLMSIIPSASVYDGTGFKADAVVNAIRENKIPKTASEMRPPPTQPPAVVTGLQHQLPGTQGNYGSNPGNYGGSHGHYNGNQSHYSGAQGHYNGQFPYNR